MMWPMIRPEDGDGSAHIEVATLVSPRPKRFCNMDHDVDTLFTRDKPIQGVDTCSSE